MKVGILIGGAIIGLIGIVLVLNFARVGTKADDQQAVTKAATSTAAEWLARWTTGNTSESWDAASSLLQNAIAKEQFAQKVAGVRKPLGDCSREI